MLAPSDDPFWSIKAREQQEEDQLQAQIDYIKSKIEVARRVAALQHASGFQDFVSSVRQMRDKRLFELVNEKGLTDQGLREHRGRVKALDEVLTLLTREAVSIDLAEQLTLRQNLLNEALKRRPKPKDPS